MAAHGVNTEHLVSGLYDAALQPALWPTFLEELKLQTGGVWVTLGTGSIDRGELRILSSQGISLGRFEAMYEEYDHRDDPRRRFFMKQWITRRMPYLSYDALHTPESQKALCPVTNVVHRQTDGGYHITGFVEVANDYFGCIHVERSLRQGQVGDEGIGLFERLLPHLERALQISSCMDRLEHSLAMSRAVLDRLSHGVGILDADGCLLEANAAARRMAGDGFVIDHNGIRALHRSAEDDLKGLIRSTLDICRGADTLPGGALALPRKSGLKPHWVLVAPLFNDNKNAVLSLFSEAEHLDDRTRERTLEYLEEFYELINDVRRIDKEILGRCRGGVVRG